MSPAPSLAQVRHTLHQHPEVGLQLPTTQATVLEALAGLDLEISTGRELSSIAAVLRGSGPTASPRPAVLLRADMDALPIIERTDVPFRSRNSAMHACGHDLHMAMLIGVAHRLARRREELCGDVVLMFQPGEENDDGAARMLAEGVLDASGNRVGAAWSLHVLANLARTGQILTRPGPVMASSTAFEVTIRGQGGHGGVPGRARDPLPAACEMVLNLPGRVTRAVDPQDPVVLTTGQLHSGATPNALASQAVIGGTFRCLDTAVVRTVRREIDCYTKQIATTHDLRVDVRYDRDYPITINDPRRVRQAAAIITQRFGPSRFEQLRRPLMGSEDFSRVLQVVPGAMLLLGASTHAEQFADAPDNHSPTATFSDTVLDDGADLLTELAVHTLLRDRPGA